MIRYIWRAVKHEAQLSQTDRATLRVTEYFAKSLKVTQVTQGQGPGQGQRPYIQGQGQGQGRGLQGQGQGLGQSGVRGLNQGLWHTIQVCK